MRKRKMTMNRDVYISGSNCYGRDHRFTKVILHEARGALFMFNCPVIGLYQNRIAQRHVMRCKHFDDIRHPAYCQSCRVINILRLSVLEQTRP